MKKYRFLLFFIFMALCHNGIGQKANYRIVYQQCIQFDTLKTLYDTVGYQATLVGNNNYSNYTWNKIYTHVKDTNSITVAQLYSANKSGTTKLKIGGAVADSFGNQVFYNKRKDSILLREKMKDEYVITRELRPEIDWKILQDKMIIAGFNCIKAVGDFRGRHYTAWFTTDIPIVEGPWKFKGLPGLILKIVDDRNQVKIYAVKVEYPVTVQELKFEGEGTLMSNKTYVEYRDKELAEMLRKMEQMNTSQEGFSKTGLSPKIKKKQGIFGIELIAK